MAQGRAGHSLLRHRHGARPRRRAGRRARCSTSGRPTAKGSTRISATRSGPWMRGLYRTQPDGSYVIRTVAPIAYTIPMDGTVGELMNRTNISHMRPAHIHFAITRARLPRLRHPSVPEGRRVHRDRRGLWREGAADRRFREEAAGQGADRRDDGRRRSTRSATTSCCRSRRRRSPRRSERTVAMLRAPRAVRSLSAKTGPASHEREHHAPQQAAVPRRPCRQPAASGRPEGSAGASASAARSARDELTAIEDREIDKVIRKQEQVGLQVGHRRRVPPRLLELRFSRPARRRRGLSRRAQDQVPGTAAQADDAARDRQARLLQRASDDRAFQVRRRAHQGDAEDDDPVAVVAAFPLRARRGAGSDLSGDGRFLSRPRRELPQGGARLCRCRLPLSPARRGQLHLSLRSEAARRSSPTAARIRSSFRISMPA